jgi:hypothetical protein
MPSLHDFQHPGTLAVIGIEAFTPAFESNRTCFATIINNQEPSTRLGHVPQN